MFVSASSSSSSCCSSIGSGSGGITMVACRIFGNQLSILNQRSRTRGLGEATQLLSFSWHLGSWKDGT